MTYPDGRVVHYEYDDAMRVSRVWSEKDGTTKDFASNVEHLPFGPLASYTIGDYLTTSHYLTALRTYDLDYRLAYLKSGPMMRRSYGYDNNGNITSISDAVHPEKDQLFDYDKLDRLTIADGAWGNLPYSYDSAGNRTDHAYVSGTNKLAAPYEYDSNGNMTSDGVLDYIYENSGGPISYYGASGALNLYSYTGGNPANYVDESGLLFGVNAGESYGEEATLYYANIAADPESTWYEIAYGWAGGIPASLWTPETSEYTFLTLSAAYSLSEWAANNKCLGSIKGGFKDNSGGTTFFRYFGKDGQQKFRFDYGEVPSKEYRKLPHYHRRPGIGKHRPWDGGR